LLQGNGALAPDVVAPPRADEPGKGGLRGTDPSLDPRKSESLQGQQIATQTPTQPIVTPPLVVNPVDPPVVTARPREVSWGRWAAVMDQPATSGVSKAGAERIAMNDYFVLFRSRGRQVRHAADRQRGIPLASSTAYVKDREAQTVSLAQVSNGQLSFNFDKASFATQFDLLSQAQTYKFGSTVRSLPTACFTR
jgi:hypothetical protein